MMVQIAQTRMVGREGSVSESENTLFLFNLSVVCQYNCKFFIKIYCLYLINIDFQDKC